MIFMNHESRNHELEYWSGLLSYVPWVKTGCFMVFLGSGNPRESLCWSVSHSLLMVL